MEGWQRSGATAGRETNLFDSLGVLPHPRRLRQHLLHRVCRIAAICARQGRALADRTQGDGRAAAQRTVVERVDHVVHNPERLVAVEGPVDRIAVRHGGF